jgi:adenylate cyclase
MEPGRETAVIFAELLGAAEALGRADDVQAHAAVGEALANLEQVAASSGARVLKRIGARLLIVTADADSAARTAVALQAAAHNFTGEHNFGLGVGFHFGPVIQDESDVFGDTVNTAARLVEKAARGQILLDAETADGVASLYRRSIRRLYQVQLKGLKEEISLCEIVWRADEPATFYPFDAAAPQPGRVKLKLKYRGEKLTLRRNSEALTIGRDPACGIVVDGEHASRQHCVIARRNDKFVLADKSTNGTFVTVEGEEEVMLQRDEITLRKQGWISFGRPRGAGGEVVEFFCD